MIDAAKQIKELRKQKGWSIRKLAEKAGVNYMTIFHIEHRECGPSLLTYELIMTALGRKIETRPMEEKKWKQ